MSNTSATGTTPGNKLLAALPARVFDKLSSQLKTVDLEKNEVLWDMDEVRDVVYFPIDAMICLLYEAEDGTSVEVGMTGRLGMVGVVTFLGDARMAKKAVVQQAGKAYMIAAGIITEQLKKLPAFKEVCMAYTQALLAQISQSAICNRLHPVDKQLCKYLLICRDNIGSKKFSITQAQIADTLGVRRETVSAAARRLRGRGLIDYRRGEITIKDRVALEDNACECYGEVKQQYNRILKGYTAEHGK